MNSFPLFVTGLVPGVALGALSGVWLSRSVARQVKRQLGEGGPPAAGISHRILLVLAAFWLGSRFGVAGLLGSLLGFLAGFTFAVVRRVREVSRG